MKRLLMVVVPVLLLLGGFLIWWNQPAKVVARRVQGLLQAATVEEGSGNITKGTRGTAVEKYLAPKVKMNGPADGEDDEYTNREYLRGDLVSLYSMLAQSAKSISLQKPEIESVEIDGDKATVHANVDAVVEVGSRRILDGIQKMTLIWVKNPEGWQLSEAGWTETGR